MNTQLQKTPNTNVKSATKASCNTMVVKAPMSATEHVKVGDYFVCTWGYEQTNVNFYQVVGVAVKTVKLCEVAKNNVWIKDSHGNEDHTAGGYATPIKDQFVGKPFNRHYRFELQSLKISDHQYASIWDGKPERFSCYA